MDALLREHGVDLYVRYPFTRAGDDEGLREDLLSLARFLSREVAYQVDYSSCEYGSVKVNVNTYLRSQTPQVVQSRQAVSTSSSLPIRRLLAYDSLHTSLLHSLPPSSS